jgi:hypothetical protein
MNHPQDKNVWIFLFFVVASAYALAAFDPTQRAAVIDRKNSHPLTVARSGRRVKAFLKGDG